MLYRLILFHVNTVFTVAGRNNEKNIIKCTNLYLLQKNHDKLNAYQCQHCSCKLASMVGLYRHIYLYHPRPSSAHVPTNKIKSKTERNPVKAAPQEKEKETRPRVVSNILFRCKICKMKFTRAKRLR
jgi:predicted SprT family Zn-dependent metalloprotease